MQSAVTCSKIRCAMSGVAFTKKVSESNGSVLMFTPAADRSRRRIAVRARPSVMMPWVESAPEPERYFASTTVSGHSVTSCAVRNSHDVRSPFTSGARRLASRLIRWPP